MNCVPPGDPDSEVTPQDHPMPGTSTGTSEPQAESSGSTINHSSSEAQIDADDELDSNHVAELDGYMITVLDVSSTQKSDEDMTLFPGRIDMNRINVK
jgi:hypothetical protein